MNGVVRAQDLSGACIVTAPRGWFRVPARLASATVVALAVVGALQLSHAGQHEAHEISPLLHWLRDSALALPAALEALIAIWLIERCPF